MTETATQGTSLRVWLVELFVFGNLAFLALDIYLAHSINDFAHPAEWIPFYFSLVVPPLMLPGVIRRECHRGVGLKVGLSVGVGSVLVGIAGMLLHLSSNFFQEQTLKALVYTAPFAAPLAYSGVGFLLILNRMEPAPSRAWGPWVVFLALCGFVGTLALSLFDHAQNGFFVAAEWIPVIASAFAVSFLVVMVLRQTDRLLLNACVVVMFFQILVGMLGFGLHLFADLNGPATSLAKNVIYGAPLFAPLR